MRLTKAFGRVTLCRMNELSQLFRRPTLVYWELEKGLVGAGCSRRLLSNLCPSNDDTLLIVCPFVVHHAYDRSRPRGCRDLSPLLRAFGSCSSLPEHIDAVQNMGYPATINCF